MAGCKVTIDAPDALGANLIEIELQRRGAQTVRDGLRLSATVADGATGAELASAVTAISATAVVAVDGGAPAPPNGAGAVNGSYALVIGPAVERREKWDAVLRRIETQVARDAGRPALRCGSSFAVHGFASRDVAAQASAAVIDGLNRKLNFEDAKVAVVPDAVAGLMVNVDSDRRQLLMQVGYAAESACLLQIQVRDPARREQLQAQMATRTRVALCDERLVAGFAGPDDARALVEALDLPADAAVQITIATAPVFDLGSKLQRIHDDAIAREIPYLFWDATQPDF